MPQENPPQTTPETTKLIITAENTTTTTTTKLDESVVIRPKSPDLNLVNQLDINSAFNI